jgi:hypothetical protein
VVLEPPPGADAGGASTEAFIFVSDASAEAERLTASLRSRGYLVVDVPLGLLLGRVGAQRPAMVLCDADSPDVLDVIERVKEVPGPRAIEVVFLVEPGRNSDERAVRLAAAIFPRPVDVEALSQKVESLIGRPARRSNRPSAIPFGSRAPVLVAATRRPYRYDTRARPSVVPRASAMDPAALPTIPPRPGGESLPPPSRRSDPDGLSSMSDPGRLSPELSALLGRAEDKIGESRAAGERLSPEAEIDAVLPPDLLAALDEPLDDLDDDDDDLRTPGSQSSEGSSPSRAGSKSGHDSAAGTAPGGSINPFATRDGTTGSHEHPEAVLDAAEPEPAAPGLDAVTAPPFPETQGAPTQLPSADMTGPGTVPPSRAWGEVPSVIDPPPPPSEPPPPGPVTPRQAQSTKPPRGGKDRDAPRAAAAQEGGAQWASIDIPHTLRGGDSVRVMARAVRARFSGAIAFEDSAGIRRAVFRDGDFVTAASGIDGESLVAFLGERGDLRPEAVQRLGRKLPQFGRHAGAALIAQGHLRQDDLWPVLRAHAEWLLTRLSLLERGAASLERQLPPRISAEPSVFGGATGAEVLIEVVRRAVPPNEAVIWLGGAHVRFAEGEAGALLGESALPDSDLLLVRSASGSTLGDLLDRAGSPDIAPVLFSLVELGVLRVRTSAAPARNLPPRVVDPLDHEALRARIRARRELVDEGDYFALLGVSRSATSYDIRRAYSALRQELDPGRVLTPTTADLGDDVSLILDVLDEAYEILRDQVRRDRYRRALEEGPGR